MKNNKKSKSLKTYVISNSDYMGDEPSMDMIKAKNTKAALADIFEIDESEVDEDSLMESNGDGQPYMQIFCVEDNEVVFG